MTKVAAPLARYRIIGLDDPELVPRVFGQFARRGIVPNAARVQRAADGVRIIIEISNLDAPAAAILAETLRTQVLVVNVRFALS